MNLYGVIMAGGGGTRFWPLSRQKTPKQLLNLSGKDLMVNETIDRLALSISRSNIYIVTNSMQADLMKDATVGRILPEHILSEPAARNTAACIGYAAMEILKKRGDGIMVVAPSDAFIKDWTTFHSILETAIKAATEGDKLVTLGITPTFPATGYGYIKFDKNECKAAKCVSEFKEKPCLDLAKEYMDSGNYAWNSGMFIWKASTILKHFEKQLPDIYEKLMVIGDAMQTEKEAETIKNVYPTIRNISVDYGIMEKASSDGDVLVVSGEFGWSDVGSLDMLEVLHEADENGNVLVGDVVSLESTNTIVYSKNRLVATIGLDNIIVAQTEDAILVCAKDNAQDVKKVVDLLKEQGRKEL